MGSGRSNQAKTNINNNCLIVKEQASNDR